MLHRLRLAMQSGTFEKMSGTLEADESFIGGLARNMHLDKKAKVTGTGGAGKEIVMGLLERETGKVRVKHVADRRGHTLYKEISDNVEAGSKFSRMRCQRTQALTMNTFTASSTMLSNR